MTKQKWRALMLQGLPQNHVSLFFSLPAHALDLKLGAPEQSLLGSRSFDV